METWICGSLFVSPVQPYSRANAIVLAQMSICPTIWTERHVHEQSACDSRLWSAEREIANGATERATPPPWTCLNGVARWARLSITLQYQRRSSLACPTRNQRRSSLVPHSQSQPQRRSPLGIPYLEPKQENYNEYWNI